MTRSMRGGRHRWAAFLLRPLCWFCFSLLCGARIRNRENLPSRGAVILTPNHQTYLDGPLVEYCLDRPIFYMVGKRYCELPILGSFLSAMGCIPLAEFGSANAYRSGLEVLRKGHCLAIFPEGQRTRDGSLSRLRSGAARWALSTGAPIVPVSIVGAHEAWPLGRRLPRVRRPIIVKFHRPIRCELVDGESLKEGPPSPPRHRR